MSGEFNISNFMINEGTQVLDYVEYQERNINFPLTENQLLYSGSELTVNGIYNTREQLILTGEESWFAGTTLTNTCAFGMVRDNKSDGAGLCNSFAVKKSGIPSIDEEFAQFENAGNIIYIRINKERLSTPDVAGFKKWLASQKGAGIPVIIEYTTNSPYITKYTDSQSEVFKELFDTQTYLGQNNIFNLGSVPALLTAKTVETPTPITPSKIYSLGDKRNLIDISDFNIYYEQMYHQDTKTDFILRPNYIYTLSFNYEVVNTTTDLYFSVGYGKNNYEQDIDFVQYLNLTKGRNEVTFVVPDNIPNDSKLWIRFANTLIQANVDVNIKNIQLEKGRKGTAYKSPDVYTIYPTSLGKNIFNYDDTLYLIQNNITCSDLQNGYNIKPTSIEGKSSLVVGYKGILNAGDDYCISYQKDGKLKDFKLYLTEKSTSYKRNRNYKWMFYGG